MGRAKLLTDHHYALETEEPKPHPMGGRSHAKLGHFAHFLSVSP